MTDTMHDFSALVSSRICHDLISPLGAIANGVELLSMTAAVPEVALIAESIANANARIRAFRIAFGAAEPGQRVTRAELRAILDDLGRGGRLAIDWPLVSDIERREAKLVLLALQCLETLMPWGGNVTITGEGPGRWTVTGRAERMRSDPALLSRLEGSGTGALPPEPAHVQFALLPHEVARAGGSLRTEASAGRIAIAF